jgi:protein-S-isoprenylcysteine O-methyltransferase Ste14
VQLGRGAREPFRPGGRLERAHAVEEGELAQAITIRKAGPEPAITRVAAAGQWDDKDATVQHAARRSSHFAAIAGACPRDRRPRRRTHAEENAMKTPSSDRPRLVVFPPLILLAVLVLSIALQWLVPLGVLPRLDPGTRIVCGGAILLIGALVTWTGARALLRRGTNVNPLRPTLVLATGGIYAWTRNPMYVGGAPLMIGLAIVFALDWLPLLMVPAFFVLHFGIVRREEQYLEQKFGDAFRRYKARVPRYVGVPRSDQHQEI